MVNQIIFFLHSANLICRGTDISKYFRDSLGIRDNVSRLYISLNTQEMPQSRSTILSMHQKKHYENTPIQIYWKFHLQKLKIFRQKNSDMFYISTQNIDCGYSLEPPRGGGSNEYPQSIFLSRNKKNYVYPCKPQFYYIKVGFKGVKII